MRLAILGATGQVGLAVLRAAEGRPGVTPVVIDRAMLDLDDLDAIGPTLAAAGFDVLVNAAGYTDVDGAESDAVAAFRRNAYAPEAMARACREAGARLVHVSTDYVFDGETDRPYLPDDTPGPLNVYGASKLVGEALVRRAHGAGSLIVRTSSVFGVAGRREGKGNFVETVLRLARERGRLEVVDDTTMAPTYAADLADALLSLVDRDAGAGVYHVTNRGRATWHAFAVAICKRAQEALGDGPVTVDPVSTADYASAVRRPRFSVLDTTRADELVGPLPDWEDALRRYLDSRP